MVGTYALIGFTLTYIGLAVMALGYWDPMPIIVKFMISAAVLLIIYITIISSMFWFWKSGLTVLLKLPEILQWSMLLNIFSDWSPTQLGQWLLLVPFGLELLFIMFVVPLQATSQSLLLTTEHL
jgi:hypothetical protein